MYGIIKKVGLVLIWLKIISSSFLGCLLQYSFEFSVLFVIFFILSVLYNHMTYLCIYTLPGVQVYSICII